MESLARKDPAGAKIMAGAFIETAGGNATIKTIARNFLARHEKSGAPARSRPQAQGPKNGR